VTKRKLARFAENETFENFFQPNFQQLADGFFLKDKWNKEFFKNSNPVVLELGCGKGEFTVGLARRYPYKNFIGMDIKGARMWRGAKTSQEEKLENVAFLRTRIQLIEHYFSPCEVDEIWITFPDPQPHKTKAKKRLTSPEFLDRYRKICKKNCIIHLKTDNTPLFDYSLEVIKEQNLPLYFHTFDVDKNPGSDDVVSIRTHYEMLFRGKGEKIKYLKFGLFSEK
jgi:tRNA (guanine-N7-)-methyltransferase